MQSAVLPNTNAAHDDDHVPETLKLLQRIGDGWIKRAKVRREAVDLEFDPDRDDFLETLLPFYHKPKTWKSGCGDRCQTFHLTCSR